MSDSAEWEALAELASVEDWADSDADIERKRCIGIIRGFAGILGDHFDGKPRHALLLAIEMIEDDDD